MSGGGEGAVVRASGGVLWRPSPSGPEVAVVHRPRYDDWSLPKGKVDPGEIPLVTAVREVEAALGSGEHASSVVGLDSGLLGVVTQARQRAPEQRRGQPGESLEAEVGLVDERATPPAGTRADRHPVVHDDARVLPAHDDEPVRLQVDGDVGQLCFAPAEDRPVAVAAADATVTLDEGRLERAGVPLLARGEVAEVGEDGTRGSVGGGDRAGDLHGEPSLDKGLTCGQTSAYLLDKG